MRRERCAWRVICELDARQCPCGDFVDAKVLGVEVKRWLLKSLEESEYERLVRKVKENVFADAEPSCPKIVH